MSLLVWLPLDGDTHNQGLALLPTPTVDSFTFSNNGKIGLSTSGTGKIAWHLTEDILGNIWSVATWIKATATFSSSNNIIFCKNTSAMNDCLIYFSIINGATLAIGVNGPSSSLSYNYTFTVGTWYHVAATYDGTTVALYINGLLKKTGTVTTANPGPKLNMLLRDRSNNAAGTGSGGSAAAAYAFNDFRIYNHCLSPLEVKEVYLTLILHYKFDNSEIESTTNLCLQLIQGGLTTVENNIITHNGTNSDTYWYIKPLEALVGSATYTVSCYVSGFANDTDFILWGVGALSGDNCAGYWRTYNGYNSFTFTMPVGKDGSTANFIFDDNGGTTNVRTLVFTISNVLLEKKDHATAFTDYGTTRTNTLIQDSSGYNHNGLIIGNILSIKDNTSRYNQCIYIPSGNTDYIETLSTIGNPNDTITMNIWFKSSNTSPGNNYHEIFNIATGTLEYEVAISNTGYLRAGMHVNGSRVIQNTVLLNLLNGNWHMLTMTYDGAYVRRYVDGIKKIELSASGTIMSNCKFLFGHYGINTSYHAKEAYLSDARVYATALDDNDIKNLYNISMKMDSLENIHAFNIKELGGRELIADEPLYTPYSSTATPWTSYDSNGDIYMTGTCNLGTRRTIEINPTGSTYYYDFDISMNSGNRIYLLISRYDENFTSRSNDASVNIRYINATEDINHLHLYGTINLSTDTVNPCKYIKFRALNGYTGSTVENPYLIIHSMSLREVKTLLSLKILKNGNFIVDTIDEQNGNIQFFKSGMTKAAEFIER